MALDLDTFLTAVYTIVDDLYRERLAAAMRHRPGPAPVLSDSEVLTLAICAEWGPGTPSVGSGASSAGGCGTSSSVWSISRASIAGGAPSTRPWRRSSAPWPGGWGPISNGSGCWTPSRSR